jgi:hypothetical protein
MQREFSGYIDANHAFIPNYGDRWHTGEAISTSFVDSAVNQIISRRFVKKQQDALDRAASNDGALESRHDHRGVSPSRQAPAFCGLADITIVRNRVIRNIPTRSHRPLSRATTSAARGDIRTHRWRLRVLLALLEGKSPDVIATQFGTPLRPSELI